MSDLPVLTTNQAAEMLDVHPDTVRRWCENGEITALKVGRNWAVARDDVMRRRRLQIIRAAHRRAEARQ